jgi:transcription elongation factor Elf1
MYHPASIAQLSQSQISKALNGHPVRVSAGSNHEIHVSPEQLKKIAKAHMKGKASTITLDPYQIQNHMHLLGSGVGRVNKYNKWVDALGARQVIDAGMSKGASTIGGMGVGRVNKYNKWVDALGARQVIDAGMSKGASTIGGMGVGRVNKYNKWVDALGARQVIDAGMSKGASTIGGFGLKKRGRPRKHHTGGALMAAGY